ncbi:hypothetical protein P167DRAFT_421343 [Morchella conica CCBAS932]|uniref:Uncharacterized protein n=1 Tax=Morchella conica CCBAS932 TaxID=1392247 RepID=A0A3N4KCQ6_9PEZI|nr:hypothetical protein P167DRAFT_421343 [Morchella conica CCBAS932]
MIHDPAELLQPPTASAAPLVPPLSTAILNLRVPRHWHSLPLLTPLLGPRTLLPLRLLTPLLHPGTLLPLPLTPALLLVRPLPATLDPRVLPPTAPLLSAAHPLLLLHPLRWHRRIGCCKATRRGAHSASSSTDGVGDPSSSSGSIGDSASGVGARSSELVGGAEGGVGGAGCAGEGAGCGARSGGYGGVHADGEGREEEGEVVAGVHVWFWVLKRVWM